MNTRAKVNTIVVALLSLALAVSFFVPTQKTDALGLFTPFGGYIVNVDYMTCNCGFVIFTIYDNATHMQYRIIWPYLLQALEKLGMDFGWFGMFVPRIYAQYAIWPGSDANVLGQFFPYENAVCLYIISTGCSTAEGYDGYLFQMGTSFVGSH